MTKPYGELTSRGCHTVVALAGLVIISIGMLAISAGAAFGQANDSKADKKAAEKTPAAAKSTTAAPAEAAQRQNEKASEAAAKARDGERGHEHSAATRDDDRTRDETGTNAEHSSDRTRDWSARDQRVRDREDRQQDPRERVARERDERTRENADRGSSPREPRDRSRIEDRRARLIEGLGIALGAAASGGLEIGDVERDRRGAAIGFRRGDVVVSINGHRIASQDEFHRWFIEAGPRAPIVVLRDGRDVTLYTDAYRADARRGSGAYLGVVLDGRYPHRAVIRRVDEGSPAEEAGLRRGDEILSVIGEDVRSPADVTEEVSRFEPGREVEIEIADGDRSEVLHATLGSRPIAGNRYEVAKPAIGPDNAPAVQPQGDRWYYENGRRDYVIPRRERLRNR